MIRNYRDLTRWEMEQVDRENTIILIPLGALEQHGNQAPLGTDDIIAEAMSQEIKKALGDMYYSTKENETMEETVVRLLTKYGLTVTTAESCTGGMVAAKIINVPGASDVFDQGYITYSNKSKRKILDVSKATLKKYGAVSEQTAREMALGGVLAADADACVAVTGLAGPDGGTEEKPVGLVYVSCCMKDEVIVEECHFQGTRQEIREHAAVTALDLLRRMIIRSRQ